MCEHCEFEASRQLFSRRRLLGAAAAGASLTLATAVTAAPAGPPTKPANVVTPDAALERLLAGNRRFRVGDTRRRAWLHERAAVAHGQNPFAAVLACADSRVGPELIFDESLGDLFVCRVAGNFADDPVIGSLEYAVAILNTPLIMVLGHDSCGAVNAALEAVKTGSPPPGHLPSLTEAIAPAVKAASSQPGDLLTNAIRLNAIMNARRLAQTGPILAPAVASGRVRIVSGIYHLASGAVQLVE